MRGSTGRLKPRGLTLLYELFHGRQRDSTGAGGFPLGPEGYYGDGRVPWGRKGSRGTEGSKGDRAVQGQQRGSTGDREIPRETEERGVRCEMEGFFYSGSRGSAGGSTGTRLETLGD